MYHSFLLYLLRAISQCVIITLKGGDVRKIKIDIEINFSSFLSKLLKRRCGVYNFWNTS
nr:MAG TPA: hypothetical protein [Caudoviricetes sp.]